MDKPPTSIYTVGHSTRSLEDFIRILHPFAITRVVAVRTVPRSARNPQFNRENPGQTPGLAQRSWGGRRGGLPDALAAEGVAYIHLPELGGFRRTRPDSTNTGWRNASFRGFADTIQTNGFRDGIQQLAALAQMERCAILCAEAVPWRCHRSLIGDALAARGMTVADILDLD